MRYFGVTADYCDEGDIWQPVLQRVYDVGHPKYNEHNMGFVAFKGDMGNGHVAAFSAQSFWQGVPKKVLRPV
jgi:hypothetical protein